MSIVAKAKNFFGVTPEGFVDELPMREAIPISSRSAFRPTVVAKAKRAPVYEMNQIFTFDARTFSDAQRIAEEYRDGKTVIVNLGEMSDTDARRMVDFISGLTVGLYGVPRRVTSKVFLLAHEGVNVEGETVAEAASSSDELYIRP